MAVQTSYGLKPAVAELGLIADVAYDNVTMSRAAAGNVHVGALVVMSGTSPTPPEMGQCSEIADNASTLANIGVAVFDSTRPAYTDDGNGKALYVLYDAVPVLTHGRIWMWTETATAIGDAVYVRVLASGANFKGQLRSGSASNFIAETRLKFITSTSGAGLIQVELQ